MNAKPSSPPSSILDLDVRRQALEIEAKAITDELTQPSIDNDGRRTLPMGIDTPLVDADGYPRSDIDIYRAKGLRKRLNEIRYDHKSIMKQIETALQNGNSSPFSASSNKMNVSVSTSKATSSSTMIDDDKELKARKAPKPKPKFDKASGKWVVCNWDGTVAGVENGHLRSFENLDSTNSTNSVNDTSIERSLASMCKIDNGANSMTAVPDAVAPAPTPTETTPFATINEIADNSPAARDGLKLNDTIIQIGSVNHTNHRDLQAVGEVVNGAFLEGTSITFVVQRKNMNLSMSSSPQSVLNIKVKPGRWEGNGILGCRLVKVK